MREKKPTNEPVIIQDSLDIKLSFLKNTQAQTTEEKAIKIKQELDNIPHKNKEIQKAKHSPVN